MKSGAYKDWFDSAVKSKSYQTKDGELIKISAHTSLPQCEFLAEIISDQKYSKTLEIGFAHGVSAAAIIMAVGNDDCKHVAIELDEGWSKKGLKFIELVGLSGFLDLRIGNSHDVLGELVKNNFRFDFAYVDTTKVFDHLLRDFFLIDKMLDVGGCIAFDDVMMPSIRKLARYISKLPHYEARYCFPLIAKDHIPRVLKSLGGTALGRKLFAPEIIQSDFDLGVAGNCIGFIKLDEDRRNWDFDEGF